jgi:tRNA G18 (ribose-2'-O)-methylase SpoU
MPGKIESLNASVSTAIILFEINRQGWLLQAIFIFICY